MTQAITRRDPAISLPQIYEGIGMMPPAVRVAMAADWAQAMMGVVEQKHLYQTIGGKKFLQAEAWELIGSFDECTARTRCEPIVENGEIAGYKGIAELMRKGEIVGGADGTCYLDAAVCRGKNGRDKDRAAQSAAQTWAAAKALRVKYSFVAVMGGYEPTPAEEMTGGDVFGGGQQTPSAPAESTQNNGPMCPDHHRSREKGGRVFCPTKLEDGTWCQWNPAQPSAADIANRGQAAPPRPGPSPVVPPTPELTVDDLPFGNEQEARSLAEVEAEIREATANKQLMAIFEREGAYRSEVDMTIITNWLEHQKIVINNALEGATA